MERRRVTGIFTSSGERLLSTEDIARLYECSDVHARWLMKDVKPHWQKSNIRLYPKNDVILRMHELAPVTLGLVNASYIVKKARTSWMTWTRHRHLVPKPIVRRPYKDGRSFDFWSRDDADEAVRIIRRAITK